MTHFTDLLPEPHVPHRDAEGRILHYGDPQAELQALRRGRAYRFGGDGRVLEILGADRVDLLHRLAASDIAGIPEGASVRVVFTDAKGRLVDAPWLVLWGKSMYCLCGPGRRDRLQQWIEQYTILEDVLCEPSDDHEVVDLSPGTVPSFFTAYSTLDGLDDLEHAGFLPAGELAYAQYCAETLQPRPGLDLDERFNPLEAGLREWISFDKGCYIGQEVVARLENYDKVRRRPALAYGPTPLARDAELSHEGKRGAQVVQSAERLDGEGAYALVLLEKELQQGAALHAEDGAEWIVERALPLDA